MIRRLAIALAAATVAGTAAVLAGSAVLDAEWDPAAAMTLGLAAVFLPQALIVAALATGRAAR